MNKPACGSLLMYVRSNTEGVTLKTPVICITVSEQVQVTQIISTPHQKWHGPLLLVRVLYLPVHPALAIAEKVFLFLPMSMTEISDA
jgi:hypothetical protein